MLRNSFESGLQKEILGSYECFSFFGQVCLAAFQAGGPYVDCEVFDSSRRGLGRGALSFARGQLTLEEGMRPE